jgi:hypothetical protein
VITHEVLDGGKVVCTIELDSEAQTAIFRTANGAHSFTYTPDDVDAGDVDALVEERLAEYRQAGLEIKSS